VYVKTGNPCRDRLQLIAEAPTFETFVFVCIFLNTVCLSIQWTGMSKSHEEVMNIVGYVFSLVYTVECIIKLIVYRSLYFKDSWNIFDFIVVLAAWIGFIVQTVAGVQIKILTSSFRTFRVVRIFKMVKRLK
jgi:hypothetical protein